MRKEGNSPNNSREPIHLPGVKIAAADSVDLAAESFRVRGKDDPRLDFSHEAARYTDLLIQYAVSFTKAGESAAFTLVSKAWDGLTYIAPRLLLCALAKATGAEDFQKLAENEIIFRPTKPSSSADIKDVELRNRLHEFTFHTPANESIYGWYVPASNDRPTVVFTLGNHQRLADLEPTMRLFTDRGYGFFTYDHQGYGQSSGVPSEQGFYQSLESAISCLDRRFQVSKSDMILVGNSFGSTVTVDVASKTEGLRGVMLIAPLASVSDGLADRLKNMSMPSSIFDISDRITQKFAAKDKISGITAPLLIIHGTKDSTIPFDHSQVLFERAEGTQEKYLIAILGAGHADVLNKSEALVFKEMEIHFKQNQEQSQKVNEVG